MKINEHDIGEGMYNHFEKYVYPRKRFKRDNVSRRINDRTENAFKFVYNVSALKHCI